METPSSTTVDGLIPVKSQHDMPLDFAPRNGPYSYTFDGATVTFTVAGSEYNGALSFACSKHGPARSTSAPCQHVVQAIANGALPLEDAASGAEIHLTPIVPILLDATVASDKRNLKAKPHVVLAVRSRSVSVFVAAEPGLAAAAQRTLYAGSEVLYYTGSLPKACTIRDIFYTALGWALAQNTKVTRCSGLAHEVMVPTDVVASFATSDAWAAVSILNRGFCPACVTASE